MKYIVVIFIGLLVFGGASTVSAFNKSNIVKLENKNRSVPLVLDSELSKAAQAKASDMYAKRYFSHQDSSGQIWNFLNNSHIRYVKAGENLAKGFSSDKKVVNAWLASPTHKANITDPSFTRTGIGIKGNYIVQIFIRPL